MPGGSPSFSADGSEVVYEHQECLYVVAAGGGTPRVLVAAEGYTPSRADWSWSSTTIAYACQNRAESTIWLVESDGSDQRPVPMGGLTRSTYPSWYRDLRSLVVVDSGNHAYHALWRLSVDGTDDPVRLTPADGFCAGRPSVAPRGGAEAAVAFAGRRGPFDQQNNQIWVVSPPLQAPAQLDAEQGRSPNWSPDGNWILFESDRSGDYRLYVAPAHGAVEPLAGVPVPVTPSGIGATHGEWSRQQDQIVFNGSQSIDGPQSIGIVEVPERFRMSGALPG